MGRRPIGTWHKAGAMRVIENAPRVPSSVRRMGGTHSRGISRNRGERPCHHLFSFFRYLGCLRNDPPSSQGRRMGMTSDGGDQKRGFVRNVTDEARNDLVQYPVTSGQCSSPGNDRRLRGEGKLDLTTLHGKSAERQADPTGVSPSQWQTDRTGRAARNHRVSPTRRACSGRQLP